MKHKLFTLINIIGLSIGISAALVIYLIVYFDFTFDKFHKDGNRIFRVVTNYTFQGLPGYNPGLCGPMFPAVKTDVSGIETAAPILKLPQPNVLSLNNKTIETKFKLQNDVILADENYFRIFQYKWIVGFSQIIIKRTLSGCSDIHAGKKIFSIAYVRPDAR
ncbi:MAG: ABC transporter permease [Puia sp.]